MRSPYREGQADQYRFYHSCFFYAAMGLLIFALSLLILWMNGR